MHPPVDATEGGGALYARVSSADQKADLDRQVARLAIYNAEKSWRVTEVVKEQSRTLAVVDTAEVADDLVRDVAGMLTLYQILLEFFIMHR